MLDGRPPDLLRALGLHPTDEKLSAAAAICGGIGSLDELSGEAPSAATATRAWKAYLDAARTRGSAPPDDVQLLVLLLVRRALTSAKRDPAAMKAALKIHGFNWFGTWREVNLVTAGRLYAHGMRRSRIRGDTAGGTSMTLALACWQVIEPLDHSLPEGKRRNWRGMRGSARLFLSRRDESGRGPLLRGAIEDFGIAEQCGDITAQHFQMLAEANTLLFSATGDDALLDAADAVFGRAGTEGADSPALAAQRGELMFVRGGRALGVADGDDTANEDVLSSGQDVEQIAPQRKTALTAAVSAYDASAVWYTIAIDRLGENSEVWRVRRGQSLHRSVSVRRRLAQSSQRSPASRHRLDASSDRRLDAALADLNHVASDEAKIRSDYWPKALCAKARQLVRGGAADALDEAAALVDRARGYAAEFVEADHPLHGRVGLLGREIDLRQCIRDQDEGGIRRLLDDDEVVAAIPITPLIYGARLLCGVESRTSDDNDRVLQVVDRLESAAHQTSSARKAFAASHAGTLLYLAMGRESADAVDPAILERTYALFKLADDEIPATNTRYQLARAATRLARRISHTAAVEMRTRAVELIGEAIGALHAVAIDLDTLQSDATVAGSGITDWVAADADDDTATVWHRPDVVASLLGDAYLRRDALRPARDDLDDAITWLQRSADLGNDSAACLGVLGDAHMRRGKRRGDPIALQRGIDLKAAAREQLDTAGTVVARENLSASASAAAMIWRITGDAAAYSTAATLAVRATAADPTWPWPLLQLAELADADSTVRDGLQQCASPPGDDAGQWWGLVCAGRGDDLRTAACKRAVTNEEFLRTVLGGRSQTYVLEDPHGLLSATLVLKPVDDLAQGRYERRRLLELKTYLIGTASPLWASVPEPLALLEPAADRGAVFVTRRAAGRPLSDVIADAVADGSSIRHDRRAEPALRRVIAMLAMIHAAGPEPDDIARATRRTRHTMRTRLARELTQLGAGDPDQTAAQWMMLLPDRMTLLPKRDAHTENWLITDSGGVVALDLQATTFLPVGFELAQLIEDMPALPAHDVRSRTELAGVYMDELRKRRPDLAYGLPDVDDARWQAEYACYAARRAIFTLVRNRGGKAESSGSRRLLAARRDHARAVLRQVRTIVPELIVFESLLAPRGS